MNKKFAKIVAIVTLIAMLITTVSFVAVVPFAFGAESAHSQAETEAYRKFLLEHYKDSISADMLAGKTIDEMTAMLHEKDPYTEIFKGQEESERFSEFVEGEYLGIGITASKVDGGIKVVEVNPAGTAKTVGIQENDLIVSIDGVDVRNMYLVNALDIIKKGTPGTKVTLEVLRGDKKYTFMPTRENTKAQSVRGKLIDGHPDMGYIKISGFDSDTASEFADVRTDLLKKGAKSFVLDLRDNPGGILEQSIAVAEQIMPKSSTITYLTSRGKVIQEHSVREGVKKLYPTVALINKKSASASEILAGALKDNHIATMIGETTYGKGVAQQVVAFKNGDSAKVSVFYFTTPKGHVINKVGVAPDILVFNPTAPTLLERQQIATFASMNGAKKYVQGEYGSIVLGAQQRLTMLGYYKGTVNGYFNKETAVALMAFQKARAIYPYPCLDNTTRAQLNIAITEKVNAQQLQKDYQLERGIKELTAK